MNTTTQKPKQMSNGHSQNVNELMAKLASPNGVERRRARETLVDLGGQAVQPLVAALSDDRELVRWEAAKAFTVMDAPQASEALVQRLRDEDFDVRWLAAEALINQGSVVVQPLLKALMAWSQSVELRAGAHHVLSALNRGELANAIRPVLTALRECEPELTVPLVAETALEKISPSDD